MSNIFLYSEILPPVSQVKLRNKKCHKPIALQLGSIVQVQTPLALLKAPKEIYANLLFMAWH